MEIHHYLGNKTQELDYMPSPIKALGCSSKFLITYDESGHLAINGYGSVYPDPEDDSLATGVIVGIVIGIIVLIAAAIIVSWFCCCRKRQIDFQANYQKVNEENQSQDRKNGVNVAISY
jgi:hypothetical protein